MLCLLLTGSVCCVLSCDEDTCDSGECDHVTVVDEVGKMEMFSEQFSQTIRTLTSPHSSCTVLATIPVIKGNAITLVEELRSSTKARLFEVMSTIMTVCPVAEFLCNICFCKYGSRYLGNVCPIAGF